MELEETVTVVTVVLLAAERCIDKAGKVIAERRRQRGESLSKAFGMTGGVLNELHNCYEALAKTPGFHSLRFLSAHNSGSDMSTTMLWKSTVLATYPSQHELIDQWQEQPLDHEYLQCVLRPIVVESGVRLIRSSELSASGPLGAIYARQGITQSYVFLIHKTDYEIVYASAAFTSVGDLTAEQLDTLRVCRSRASNAAAQR